MLVGLNAFEMVGAAMVTVRVAVLLPDPAVGVSVVVTPEVELGLTPTCELVTLNITVQLPPGPAGMLIPVKLSAVAPAGRLFGVVPVQVPLTEPPDALMLLRESVNAPPERAIEFPFVIVTVTTDVPPTPIVVGLNAFETVGADNTTCGSVSVLVLALASPL
jgi:hypothetical protein